MCISFNRANRIRLIVGSSEISEEAELQLTTRSVLQLLICLTLSILGFWLASFSE